MTTQGSALEEIIDNPEIETPYCYVQGMGGVNTSFYFRQPGGVD